MSNRRRDDPDPERGPIADLPLWFLDAISPDPCERCAAPDAPHVLRWATRDPHGPGLRLCEACYDTVARALGLDG